MRTLVLLTLVLASLIFGSLISGTARARGEAPVPAPRRLLIVCPHPDDESLAAARMIALTQRTGGSVRLVVMTSGDGFRKAAARTFNVSAPAPHDLYRLGLLRRDELAQAAHHLGLRQDQITLLGYPDGGLDRLWDSHWAQKAYLAKNGHDRVPYDGAFRPSAPYTGLAVIEDLQRVIADFQPSDVLFPDGNDIHKDHWATSAFTQYTLAATNASAKAWSYLIHYPQFPKPQHYRPNQMLLPPSRLQGIGLSWHSLPLSAAEVTAKHKAVLSHRSQVRMMKSLLESFVRPNELVATRPVKELPAYGAGRSPLRSRKWPFTLLTDAAGDQRNPLVQDGPASDIRECSAALVGNTLEVAVEFAAPPSRHARFRLQLRMPDSADGTPHRADLEVAGDKLHTSPHLPQARFDRSGTRLFFSLPRTVLCDSRTLLLSTEIRDAQHAYDTTPWITARLPR